MKALTPEQTKELAKPLDKANVLTREQGGKTVSYIESWKVIEEANKIFGFDGWTRETIYCKQVCQYDYPDKFGKIKQKVGYEAKVRVTVAGISREGTGTGSGIAQDLYDAIEGASKEAESDAAKRALMTFGNRFGLALYDKQQRNVEDVAAKEQRSIIEKVASEGFVPIPEESDETGVRDWPNYTLNVIDKIKKTSSFAEFNAVRSANKEGLEFLSMADEKLRAQITEISKIKAQSFKAPEQPPLH